MAKDSYIKRVAKVEEERCAAMIARDGKALDRLLDDEFYYGHTSGYFDTKAQLIAKLDNPAFQYIFFKIIDRKVWRRAGVVFSAGKMYAEFEDRGKVSRQAMVFTGVYTDDKASRCLALHVNRIGS